MFRQNRFEIIDGEPVVEQVEEWTESFFFNLMNTMNAFFTHISLEETIERLRAVNFASLVLDQLQDEPEEIRAIAVARISDLAETEISFREAYANPNS